MSSSFLRCLSTSAVDLGAQESPVSVVVHWIYQANNIAVPSSSSGPSGKSQIEKKCSPHSSIPLSYAVSLDDMVDEISGNLTRKWPCPFCCIPKDFIIHSCNLSSGICGTTGLTMMLSSCHWLLFPSLSAF